MKVTLLAGLAAASLIGCLPDDEAPLVTLDQGVLAIEVADWRPPNLFPPPDQIQFELSRFGDDPPTNAAKPTDCVRIKPSTTITANDAPGTLADVGSYQSGSAGFENNCSPPFLYFELTERPPTIDVAFDDGTAQLHVTLTIDAQQLYHVARCDFAACTAP